MIGTCATRKSAGAWAQELLFFDRAFVVGMFATIVKGRMGNMEVAGVTLHELLDSSAIANQTRDLDCVEVFTVANSVKNAALEKNFSAESYDYLQDGNASVTTRAGLLQAGSLVARIRDGGLCTLAPECKTFTFACSSVTQRTKGNFGGKEDSAVVQNGNSIALAALMLFILALARGVFACLENPAGSCLFSFLKPWLEKLEACMDLFFSGRQASSGIGPRLIYYCVDRCTFVLQKPTFQKKYKFMCSGTWFQPVAKVCTCPGRKKKKHLELMVRKKKGGKVQVNGTDQLKGSGLYPAELGAAIVLAWMHSKTAPAPTAPGPDFEDPWAEKAADTQPKKRAKQQEKSSSSRPKKRAKQQEKSSCSRPAGAAGKQTLKKPAAQLQEPDFDPWG